MTRLKLGEEGFSDQMAEDTKLSMETLDESFLEQASLFAHYAEQSRIANKKEFHAKLQLKIVESKVDKALRDEAAAEGKKITEALIDKSIFLDKDYQKAVLAYNDATANAQLLRDYLESLKQKRDCLVQLGKASAEERRGQLRSFEDVSSRAKAMFGGVQ